LDLHENFIRHVSVDNKELIKFEVIHILVWIQEFLKVFFSTVKQGTSSKSGSYLWKKLIIYS